MSVVIVTKYYIIVNIRSTLELLAKKWAVQRGAVTWSLMENLSSARMKVCIRKA